MADPRRRHPANAPGPWFVDTTCIACDVVRFVAPEVYAEAGDGKSYVSRQPRGADAELAAARGLLACPTGSVGGPLSKDLVARAWPWELEPGVSMLGYTSPASFGAMSYLVERPEGNLLVDSPRWNRHLERAIADRGGLRWVFLTHRDDVADAGRYAARFGATCVIHEADAGAAPRGVPVRTFAGEEALQEGVVAFHTPGHTEGHAMLLVQDRWLFTGDSLAWSRASRDLTAWEGVCWYDWEAQAGSLERLARERSFAWVLPGHGSPVQLPPDDLRRRLVALVARMRAHAEPGEW